MAGQNRESPTAASRGILRSLMGATAGNCEAGQDAKGRKISSTRGLERQLNDPYVKRARAGITAAARATS